MVLFSLCGGLNKKIPEEPQGCVCSRSSAVPSQSQKGMPCNPFQVDP
jgi:hypothetical protein